MKKDFAVLRALIHRIRSRTIPLIVAIAAANACGGDVTAPPRPDLVLATLTAASPTDFSAPVGEFVADLPAVVARNAGGQPLAGVLVKFDALIAAAPPAPSQAWSVTVLTGSDGIARLSTWRLSTFPVLNTVSASSGKAPPVTFRATAVAGPATYMMPFVGNNQVVAAGTAAPTSPQVLVTDAYANPVASVSVSFNVIGGGGSISGANALTNEKGFAAVGAWTMGSSGPQSLQASVDGVVGIQKVTFTAVAESDSLPCGAPAIVPLGATIHSSLTSASCKAADGTYYDTYSISTARYSGYRIKVESPAFDTYLELSGEEKVAENDDTASTTSHVKVFLAEGVYHVRVSSHTPGALGSYSVSFTPAQEPVSDCEIVYVTRGTRTDQTFGSVTCPDTGNRNLHRFRIYLTQGTQMSARLEEEDPYSMYELTISSSDGKQIVAGSGVYSLLATIKASVTGYYFVDVRTSDEGLSYSLVFN